MRGNPGGNTRRSGVHRVCRVVFLSLCSRILYSQRTIFFFFGEELLKIFRRKDPHVSQKFLESKDDTYVWVFFSPEKIFNLRREKSRGCFVSSILVQKSTSRLARNTHHTDTYLRRLKQTAIPHLCPAGREYQSSCVCVSLREEPRREY